MTLVKSLLDRVQRLTVAREALDGRHVMALRLHGQHQARPHRRAVEQHRAASAHAVLAADMRAGQAEVVAEVVAQQPP
jgi:UDP-N-acetylglucosamine enolpyruvyl transferase